MQKITTKSEKKHATHSKKAFSPKSLLFSNNLSSEAGNAYNKSARILEKTN